MHARLLSASGRGVSLLAVLIGLGGIAAIPTADAATLPPQAHLLEAAAVTPAPTDPGKGFADLVDAVSPAVVSVYVEGTETSKSAPFDLENLPPGLRRFFQQFGEQQPPTRQRFVAAGSGFAISADGYFVTNNHVVENASEVTIVFNDGTRKPAKVVGKDERTDLALLKVDGLTDQAYVQFAETAPRVGDWVIAMGNPFGLGGTVTQGVVSAKGRDIGGQGYGDFLQIDAAVNRGNSGGPTFNMKGEVVGVNAEIFSPTGGSVGIAFDIPANIVKNVANQLMQNGKVTRSFLGVSIQDVTPDIANSLGMSAPRGAMVAQINPNTPASRAGIQSGDVIVAFNGREIKDALDLSRTVADTKPGTKVQLTILRDGRQMDVSATLEELTEQQQAQNQQNNPPQPPSPPSPGPEAGALGLTVVPNSSGPGVLVQNVDPDGVADQKGLTVGDTILAINNQPVSSPQEFDQAIQSVRSGGKKTALVKIERDGQVHFIGLPLGEQSGAQ